MLFEVTTVFSDDSEDDSWLSDDCPQALKSKAAPILIPNNRLFFIMLLLKLFFSLNTQMIKYFPYFHHNETICNLKTKRSQIQMKKTVFD
ncbi:hypothetical protein D920_02104 [Enterococcus faecalis 13-SD-W-01]|nr:hypothetical protein D920_02104 [Enterococcus faecalis 13-SD-W-01]